jgi:hypothetical protein
MARHLWRPVVSATAPKPGGMLTKSPVSMRVGLPSYMKRAQPRQHVDHVEAEFVTMPAAAVFRRLVGADQVDVWAVARRLWDARVSVAEEVAQARLGPDQIATLGMMESVHRAGPVETGRIFGREG